MSAVSDYFKGLKPSQTAPTAVATPTKQLPKTKPTTNVSAFFANINKPAQAPAQAAMPPAPVAVQAPTSTTPVPSGIPPVIATGPRRSLVMKPETPKATISAPTAAQNARMDAAQAQRAKELAEVANKKPDNAFVAGAKKIVKAPLEIASNINQFFEDASKKRGLVHQAQQFGANAVSGVADTAKFVIDYIDNNPTKLLGPISKLIPEDNAIDRASREAKKKLQAEGKDTFAIIAQQSKERAEAGVIESDEWKNATTEEKFTKYLPETIYNLIPSIGGSIMPYLVSGGLGFAVAVGSTAEDVKQKALESGVDERKAENLGLGTGLAVGILDRIIPDKALPREAKQQFMGGFFKRLIKSTLGEPATEVAQENIQIAAEATFREDLGWDEIKTRNAMSALGGLFGGAGMQSVGSIANVVAGRRETQVSAGGAPVQQNFVERDGEMVPIESAPQPVTDTTPSAPEAKVEPTSNVDKLLATLAKPNEQALQTPEPNTDLVSLAEEKAGNVQKKIVLNEPISAEVSSIVKEKSGLDVTDYEHSVSNFEVQHALNKHKSDPIPLTPQDIGLIPDIIANYDKVEHAGKTKTNLDAILYTKRYNGTTYFLEEVRTGRGELAFKTMYKNKTPTGANDALRSSPRSSRPPQAEPTPIDVSTPKLTETVSEVNQPANPKIPAQRVAPVAATAADVAVATERRAPVEAPPAIRKITLEDTPLHNKIMSELVFAKAGERYSVPSDEPGVTREFRGTKSTFPTWIPKELRRKPLLEAVAEHITNGTIPTKEAELRLYKIVAAEMQAQNDVINDAEWVARERNNIINPLASDEENAAALAKFDEEYAKLKANQVGITAPSGDAVSDVGGAIQADAKPVEETAGPKPEESPVETKPEEVSKPSEEAPKEEPKPQKRKAPEKLTSAVFERLKAEHPGLDEDVEYETQNLKENAEKAVELIAEDREKAYRIAMGVEPPPAGQTATAVNIAMAEKALEDGNNTLYAQLVRQRSLEQTRRGQEIVAEKGSISDNSTSRYVKELIRARLDKLDKSYLGFLDPILLRNNQRSRAMAAVENEVKKAKKKIRTTKELDIDQAQAFLDSLACK